MHRLACRGIPLASALQSIPSAPNLEGRTGAPAIAGHVLAKINQCQEHSLSAMRSRQDKSCNQRASGASETLFARQFSRPLNVDELNVDELNVDEAAAPLDSSPAQAPSISTTLRTGLEPSPKTTCEKRHAKNNLGRPQRRGTSPPHEAAPSEIRNPATTAAPQMLRGEPSNVRARSRCRADYSTSDHLLSIVAIPHMLAHVCTNAMQQTPKALPVL